ncbi:uncharacterized protein EAE98_011718 [Botrytis deweyae]|uniref:Major facilitator superfamily (MFS) profile domain-containing protein n=1 Tax=Botrytis deweyae TaxID=2478750 RepID=A0ABQ7I4Z3_9HELO|nr:uncharacterized protein EAE98_011718 [Botrytis deweyae]KAF7911961.1 hypothetical protein EAE98_011718 [Botrytis deweyae]
MTEMDAGYLILYSLPQFTTRWITLIVGVAIMSSPISANIYLSCVPLLQRGTNVSLQLINTIITADVIIQGVAPAFLRGLLDGLGRRPVYLMTFTSCIAAVYNDGERKRSITSAIALQIIFQL